MFASAYSTAAAAAMMVITVVLSTPGPQCRDYESPWEQVGGWWSPGHAGPAWGRDERGALIVFRWNEGSERTGSLYSIREDGTELRLLSPSPGDARALGGKRIAYDASPAISPDGTRVAYATLRHSDEQAGFYDIVTVAPDGGERRLITDDIEGNKRAPAWSPDGTRIAFLKDNYLHTMAPDGSDVRSIAQILAVSEPPAWSPDGTRIAFRGRTAYEEELALYIVGADGSNLTRVAEDAADDSVLALARNRGLLSSPEVRPSWSPDGRRIAFVLFSAFVPDTLYTVAVDGGRSEALARGGFGPLLWSPDSAEIFHQSYVVSVGDDQVSAAGLFAVAVEGQHEIRPVIDPNVTGTVGLAWSPAGGRLAVRRMSVSSSRARELGLLDPYADVVLFTVAPDGSDLRVLVREGPDGELVAEGEVAR